MGISCQINLFKPPNSVYQPGDVVSGIIKYVLPEQMEFDKIVTSLKGSGLLEVRVSAQNIHTGDENVQSSNETYVDIDHVVTNGKTKVPAVQGHSKVKACEDVPNTGAKIGRIDCGILKPLAIDMNVPIDRATLQNSKVIKRDYVVRTKVTLPMPHRNIVLDIPIEIGPINNFMPRNIPNELNVTPTAPPAYWETMVDTVNVFSRE
ncbi:unnamed protein product [Arctia plantaginis]|uniref:Arrestin C-terminal-like domain-containing protein n=1 Tax=Arctia plantaginis TaxID=874455 RepID=A0A8S1BPZ2_ARCPL|nr:unnamed protein product [Arctia plantaginis]